MLTCVDGDWRIVTVVTIIKRGEGSEGDTILRNVDAYADAVPMIRSYSDFAA